MKLSMTYYGNPILRRRADEIVTITDEIRELAVEMEKVMDEQKGLGLAAPQIGHSIRVFITKAPVQKTSEEGEEEWERGPLRVFINPVILSYTEESWVYSEGCLSIPKIYGDVERPLTISVEALDLEGNRFVEQFTGWPARVILHENDHLNGVLFIDRLPKKERKKLEEPLKRIKKTYGSY